MNAKLILIGLVIQCVYKYAAATSCAQFEDKRIFHCDTPDETIVNILGDELKCPSGQICNAPYVYMSGACSPCLPPKGLCDKLFTCASETEVKMGNTVMKCPTGETCNETKEKSCHPCLGKTCGPEDWTCTDRPEEFIMDGEVYQCPPNRVCNKDYLPPCSPCILPTKSTSLRNFLFNTA